MGREKTRERSSASPKFLGSQGLRIPNPNQIHVDQPTLVIQFCGGYGRCSQFGSGSQRGSGVDDCGNKFVINGFWGFSRGRSPEGGMIDGRVVEANWRKSMRGVRVINSGRPPPWPDPFLGDEIMEILLMGWIGKNICKIGEDLVKFYKNRAKGRMNIAGDPKGKQPMGSVSTDPLTTPRKGLKSGSGGVHISEGINIPEVDVAAPPKSSAGKKKKKKKSIDREKLKALQGKVQANITALSLTSLFATIIGDPIEAREIRKRIKFVWKFLTGGFQLIPFANNWFELRFDVVEDRQRVWEARPFHISGQLMVLRPWRLDLDPWTESITKMDLWVRFPRLPVKYIDEKLLKDIVEDNELGEVLRVAAFNDKGEEESYPVWFEDFPDGCGCCGSHEHVFDSCPLRVLCNPSAGGSLGDFSVQAESDAVPASEVPQQQGEWVNVTRKNIPPPPPPMFGHNKSELLKLFGTNVVYYSDSSSSKTSSKSGEGSMTNPVVMQNYRDHGFEPQMDPDLAIPNVSDGNPVVMQNYGADGMDPLMVPDADMSNMFDGLQTDADGNLIYPEPTASELYAYDNDDMLDYGDALEPLEGFGEFSYEVMQDAMEEAFSDVPPSSEYHIANISNPAPVAPSTLSHQAAPSEAALVAREFESLGVETPNNSESSKRKLVEDDDDAVSSGRMGAGGKKGRHDI